MPLLAARPSTSDLGPEKGVAVYQLDMDRLSHAQIERLSAFVVERFGVSKRTANAEIASNGFPIREADVDVVFSMRAFL